MNIHLRPRNKPAEEFFIFLKNQDGPRRSKVQNRSNLTPQFTSRLRIWIRLIRFGQYLAWTYYLTLETIQDGRRRSKLKNLPNFTPKITFRLVIWIRFIRFGPNLAGRYFSTQGTSLRKNFWSFAKYKMAVAAAITANYEIGHNLKRIQVRDPFFP